MDINSVPQDDSSTYAKNKKAIYAADENGNVSVVASSGWEVEEAATKQALSDLEESAKDAYTLVKNGKMSPLYFHMYAVRMDLQVLSESSGFFKWTIKKDFNPDIFTKIKEKRLLVYADAMGKSIQELKVLPKGLYE
ncbi:FIG00653968: hypothetical protein [hydrothermal vent metagenome]|uniref:Uncharacterized protein n=1 Tax=hydrothermal vent metagenome TaxID=652676 RepID=A0A1W1CA11_9ZZZZ